MLHSAYFVSSWEKEECAKKGNLWLEKRRLPKAGKKETQSYDMCLYLKRRAWATCIFSL